MSTVDWPGKFAASLFLQGCPWVCPYCHNSAIIDPRIPGVVAWSALEDLLARRRGLLDGVVFSGGEATRQIALGAAMAVCTPRDPIRGASRSCSARASLTGWAST